MADHQQIGGELPIRPLVPSTSSSSQSSNPAQEEYFVVLHTLIISLITIVGGYVQFQFQYKKLSLFAEHGNIMRAIFVMLFFYVMGLMAEFKLQNQSKYLAIMQQFTPLFGLLVVVLLLFVLSLSLGLAASIVWAFLVVGPTIRLFQQIIQWLRGIILQIQMGLATTIIWAFLVVGPTIRLQIIQWLRGIIPHIHTHQAATSNMEMEESESIGIHENDSPV